MTDETDAENEVIEEAPEAIEAEAEVVEEEPQEPSESSTEKEEPEKSKVQERIDELTRLRRETERERDYWKEQASKPPEPVKPLELKTLEDFDYDEKAYQAYFIETSTSQAVEAAKQALKEESLQREAKTRQKAFETKESKYAEDVTDYMKVTRDENLRLTKEMVDIVALSDDGPSVLYYLGKNPDISAAIADLSPLAAAREIGRIEAKLSKEPKSASKAPPPPPKIKGGDPVIKKSPDEMTQKEFNAYRRKVIANRGN